jgi:hypothetical protein
MARVHTPRARNAFLAVEEVNYDDDDDDDEHEATEAELQRAEEEALEVRARRQKDLEQRRKELESIEYDDEGTGFDHRAFETKCAHPPSVVSFASGLLLTYPSRHSQRMLFAWLSSSQIHVLRCAHACVTQAG